MTPEELADIQARHLATVPGDDWTWREIEMKADIAALLAEVKRLTPPAKVARWGFRDFGGTLWGEDGRRVASYFLRENAKYEVRFGNDHGATTDEEPEARAHIVDWAKSMGYEVEDAS